MKCGIPSLQRRFDLVKNITSGQEHSGTLFVKTGMKEVRAVVVGVAIVVLVALFVAFWRRPARELKRVSGYRIEIEKSEGGSRKHVSFTVPMALVARVASFVPFADIGADARSNWNGEVTPHDILIAADQSAPGKPGVISKGSAKIEVSSEGSALEIVARDDWGKTVRLRVPRSLVESLSGEKRLSPRDLLRKLDELGPGDVVVIRDRDDQVTITAIAR
jgi:hypothetical protein